MVIPQRNTFDYCLKNPILLNKPISHLVKYIPQIGTYIPQIGTTILKNTLITYLLSRLLNHKVKTNG